MTAQLNVKINSDLKQAFKFKCEIEGIPMEVALNNALADLVGKPEFRIDHDRVQPSFIPPLDPVPGWCPEIEGVSFAKVDQWLKHHSEKDTSILEVWTHCFQRALRRSPNVKEIKKIGIYLQRNGWGKTQKVSSTHRANRLYGRSVVFVKMGQDQSDLMV